MEAKAAAPVMEVIRDTWETLLQKYGFGDEEDFFVLGGDSMLGMMMLMSLTEHTGREFTLSDLYENSTLAELTALVVERTGH
jgi:aryl carrier-like protein